MPRSSASLAAAHGVDHHAGAVRAVPHLQVRRHQERHIAERRSLDADLAELAVGQPGHVVAGADVDVLGASSSVSCEVTALVLEIFLLSSRSRSSMFMKSVLPPKLSW